MTHWVRLWADMPTDPKWRVIARKSGQPISLVIAVYTFLLVNASANANERGRTHNWFNEDVAAALDVDEDKIAAIIEAMQGKVLDGEKLTGWEKRQPKREDNSADRAKKWREERKRTQSNAKERPDADADTEVTLAKANAAVVPDDPEAVMWAHGRKYLAEAGVSSDRAGSLLGKWRGVHGSEAVIVALGKAKREGAIDPVSFIEGCFRHHRKQAAQGEKLQV